MHDLSTFPKSSPSSPGESWWRLLNRYQWFVFVVAALGWLFDTMDQQLFALARQPAVRALLHSSPDADPEAVRALVASRAGIATAIFMIGWATGGLAFGILGDRIGRARTMLLTILLYSLFTGLSAFSVGIWDFAFYRFLTGLGVGGEFAVGVALVAEVMPERARPHALAWLQGLSAVGNIAAACTGLILGQMQQAGLLGSEWVPWRIMFLIGTVPALVALLIRWRLKEPERWQAVAASGKQQRLGSMAELFQTPLLRRNAVVGLLLALAGIIGLWGIGFFSYDFIRDVFRRSFEEEGLEKSVIDGRLTLWAGIVSILQNLGGFFGIYVFGRLAQRLGRKPAFVLAFTVALLSTVIVFGFLRTPAHVFWMIPLMGFCQLSLFGLYAIYFPELFPTRLRSTGISFCYNVGRYLAAIGPYTFGLLDSVVFAGYAEPKRYAGVAMSAVFLIGLVVLPFAPETRDQPLPE